MKPTAESAGPSPTALSAADGSAAPRGLTSGEASGRRAKYGPNEIQRDRETSSWLILAQQFAGPVVWLLVGACAISAAVGEVADAIAIGLRNLEDLREAIVHRAVKRVQPKAMTVAATFIGLMPIMCSMGTGADLVKRIAAPMVGGLVTSFLLELLVYPPIYLLWRRRELGEKAAQA